MGDETHQLNNITHSMSETLLQELQLRTESGIQISPKDKTLEADNYYFNGAEEQRNKVFIRLFLSFPDVLKRALEESELYRGKEHEKEPYNLSGFMKFPAVMILRLARLHLMASYPQA